MSTFGTLLLKEGNLFVEIGGKLELLPVAHGEIEHLKPLIGKKVEVILSEPKRFIAGVILAEESHLAKRPPRILCYVPAPDYFKAVIEERARIEIAKQMLESGLLSKEAFNKITAPEVIRKEVA